MDPLANALNWFEIPVTDIERAQKFYEGIFAMQMFPLPEMMGMKMAGFPMDMNSGKVSGALAQSDFHKSSAEGVIVYLNANPEIQAVIDRVEEFGGTVAMPRTEISPEIGVMAFFIDTEGNRIGLHAQQ
ncbi:VOC family protein [Mucilaginibacter celer]|uniref:VOC family protein n=1 Tax=Mucilaginibacter celer TaxID=2305508 RepID=A0A494VI61_9SPHI|nr:VOC family protein [Mucilaginibacter celer]AYL94516.1 VOC family protein [Mucilaginibacter celer]